MIMHPARRDHIIAVIDRTLPYVGTWPSTWDLTDTKERKLAVEWVYKLLVDLGND